jgi:hypothetical protein
MESIGKEALMAYFEALNQNTSKGTEESKDWTEIQL